MSTQQQAINPTVAGDGKKLTALWAPTSLRHPAALCLRPRQVAPLLPPSHHWLVAAVQADRYYQLLVPLTVPVTIFAVSVGGRLQAGVLRSGFRASPGRAPGLSRVEAGCLVRGW